MGESSTVTKSHIDFVYFLLVCRQFASNRQVDAKTPSVSILSTMTENSASALNLNRFGETPNEKARRLRQRVDLSEFGLDVLLSYRLVLLPWLKEVRSNMRRDKKDWLPIMNWLANNSPSEFTHKKESLIFVPAIELGDELLRWISDEFRCYPI